MKLRPSAALNLTLLPLCMLCVWLAFWQLERMEARQGLFDTFDQAPMLELTQAIAQQSLFAHVRATGRYEPGWNILLDNKILNGRVGVHALSLFRTTDGVNILVNRGWLPLAADRRSLPDIPTPQEKVSLNGILVRPLQDGVRLGKPQKLGNLSGTHLVTYLDMNEISAAMVEDLTPWLVALDADETTGFEGRVWKPAVMLPGQHRAYAVQWFALAVAIIIMWFTMARRRGRVLSKNEE